MAVDHSTMDIIGTFYSLLVTASRAWRERYRGIINTSEKNDGRARKEERERPPTRTFCVLARLIKFLFPFLFKRLSCRLALFFVPADSPYIGSYLNLSTTATASAARLQLHVYHLNDWIIILGYSKHELCTTNMLYSPRKHLSYYTPTSP